MSKCMYCEDEFKDDDEITYVNNAFAQPHRARKYHNLCFQVGNIK